MRKTYIKPKTRYLVLASESIIASSPDWGGDGTPGSTGGMGPGDPNDELGTRKQDIWSCWEEG